MCPATAERSICRRDSNFLCISCFVLCAVKHLYQGMNNRALALLTSLHTQPRPLQYQRLTWEHFIKSFLFHFNSFCAAQKTKFIFRLKSFRFERALKWRLEWIWNGLPLLLFYKLLPNLLALLICQNLWIISMKKLSGFTRDFGQKEVTISHKRSIHSVLDVNI